MTTPPVTPRMKVPDACPGCGTKTSTNIARPQRAGLHCHTDDTAKWATHCGIVLCGGCGIGYSVRDASKGPMNQLRRQ